ncbi:MAG: MarR family winged helix-turn-helix transcriptional regulator [Jatrophihabitantaceae bacterium]
MTGRSGDDAALVRDWGAVVRGVDAVQHGFALRLESMDMTLPYFSVLTLLLDSDEQRLPMSRIARDLAMTSGGFTKLADRMARDGLIDRRGSSGDRRVVFAALTDAGRERAHAALEVYQSYLHEQVLPVVPPPELRTLAEIAGRLTALAGESDAVRFELTARAGDETDRRGRD